MNANAATAAPAPAATLLRRAGPLDTMVALVRRELQEHRALWIAPLVLAALIALLLVLFGLRHIDIPQDLVTTEQKVAGLTIMQFMVAQMLFGLSSIVVTVYLLDCLYAERKDRSILFWKSLPLSDELTVCSKLVVALVVVPLGTLLVAAAADLVYVAIIAVRVPGAVSWSTYEWLRTELALFVQVVIDLLWYAPIAAGLLLLSAWIPRNPLLWALLVPIVPPVVEWFSFGTRYIMRFELYRLKGIWPKLINGPDQFANGQHLPTVGAVFGRLNLGPVFTDVDLWLGVAAAAVMVYAAARIRRYRDDT